MKSYFYRLLARYIGLFARSGDVLVNVDPPSEELDAHLAGCLRKPSAEVIAHPPDADFFFA